MSSLYVQRRGADLWLTFGLPDKNKDDLHLGCEADQSIALTIANAGELTWW